MGVEGVFYIRKINVLLCCCVCGFTLTLLGRSSSYIRLLLKRVKSDRTSRSLRQSHERTHHKRPAFTPSRNRNVCFNTHKLFGFCRLLLPSTTAVTFIRQLTPPSIANNTSRTASAQHQYCGIIKQHFPAT